MFFLLLWGDELFNIGVGMVWIFIVVVFVKYNMLIGFQECFLFGQGGFSDQDVVDVVEYFLYQLCLDFLDKIKDWLKDKCLLDVCY